MHAKTLTTTLALTTTLGLAALDLARAADTVEVWDPGAANVEVYGMLDGIGRSGADQALGGDMLAGWGLARGFGAYLGTTLSASGHLTDGQSELGLGVIAAPLDGEHWDLDLMLDVRAAGDGHGDVTISPAFELNWDRAPDLAAWGLYLRGGAAMTGVETAAGSERLTDVCLALGAYWSLSPRAQLLLEVDGDLVDGLGDARSEFRAGGVAMGYNLVLGETLEWINEVRVDIPDAGEDSQVSYLVGLIATLPAAWR